MGRRALESEITRGASEGINGPTRARRADDGSVSRIWDLAQDRKQVQGSLRAARIKGTSPDVGRTEAQGVLERRLGRQLPSHSLINTGLAQAGLLRPRPLRQRHSPTPTTMRIVHAPNQAPSPSPSPSLLAAALPLRLLFRRRPPHEQLVRAIPRLVQERRAPQHAVPEVHPAQPLLARLLDQ